MENRLNNEAEFLPDVMNPQTLGELYDRHYETVLRYCHKRLYLHAVAEDVTSNVFLCVAKYIRRFTGRTVGDFRCWLYGIANNEIAAYLRKNHRRRRLFEAAVLAGELTVTEIDNKPQTNHSLDVLSAMIQLPPADQDLIALRYWENLSHNKIARILSLRNGAVRTRLNRALNRLRKLLPDDSGKVR